MTADFELKISLTGTSEELKNMLQVISRYESGKHNPVYFTNFSINGLTIKTITEEQMKEIIDSGSLDFSASGPYGRYDRLDDIKLFKELADAAPEASFKAQITGEQQYSIQSLECELKNQLLKISTMFEANDAASESWIENCMDKFPLYKFKRTFHITGRDFDETAYHDVLEKIESICHDDFEEMEYNDFISMIEEYNATIDLDEDDYFELMEHKLTKMGIVPPIEMEEEHDTAERNQYIYDPVSKMYSEDSDLLLDDFNIDDAIQYELKTEGYPDDDKEISNLSVDQAFSSIEKILNIKRKKPELVQDDFEEEFDIIDNNDEDMEEYA